MEVTAKADPAILQIASLTELPKQPINLRPVTDFLGVQVQQLRVASQPPTVDNQAPISVTRQNLGGGQYRFRVQFFQPPPGQPYAGTSILLRTPLGSTTVASSGSAGPLTYTSLRPVGPVSAVVQQTTPEGAASNPGIGTDGGNSRAIGLL